MDLVEGEGLSQRVKVGAIPVDEAVEISRQIAEALEDAHEHDIVTGGSTLGHSTADFAGYLERGTSSRYFGCAEVPHVR